MGYAIHQDMQEVYDNPDKWVNHGRDVLMASCNHYDKDKNSSNTEYSGYCEKCDISEDSAIPIMNYLYPLELTDFEDEKILKVVKETNCTILENTDSGEWFLALCGGGMDLSQDIAFSYVILERWIPENLITEVISQKEFSINKRNFEILRKAVIEQAEHYKNKFENLKNKW